MPAIIIVNLKHKKTKTALNLVVNVAGVSHLGIFLLQITITKILLFLNIFFIFKNNWCHLHLSVFDTFTHLPVHTIVTLLYTFELI